ncbi:hypothetical protein QTP88_005921 [Uroleucon formosanum]
MSFPFARGQQNEFAIAQYTSNIIIMCNARVLLIRFPKEMRCVFVTYAAESLLQIVSCSVGFLFLVFLSRKEIIRWLVDNIDNNESFSISILEAIIMSDKAWRSVTP